MSQHWDKLRSQRLWLRAAQSKKTRAAKREHSHSPERTKEGLLAANSPTSLSDFHKPA